MFTLNQAAGRRRLMFMTEPAPEGAGDAGSATDETAGQSTADGTTEPAETAEKAVDWEAQLQAQKKVNKDLERKLKATLPREEAEQLRGELAKLQGKEKEFEEQAKARELEAQALAKANDRILKAEVRAAAAGKLHDPADALRHLDLSDFEVGEDGEVDTAAVTEAIEALVKSKPYLAAQGGSQSVFESPTSTREGSNAKAQWSRDDLKGKTPEQIEAARAEGHLNDLLGIPN